jgi:hypothetical protein
MTVSEMIEYLSAVPSDYRVVLGNNTDLDDIDYVETDYTSELVSLWTKKEDTP